MRIDPRLAARLRGMSATEKLDAALSMLVAIDRRLRALEHRAPQTPVAGGAEAPASEEELDHGGDEEVKKNPKRWQGEDHAGKRMSACPADYLLAVAEFCEWAANASTIKATRLRQQGEEAAAQKELVNAGYRRRSARRARGWFARAVARERAQDEKEEW